MPWPSSLRMALGPQTACLHVESAGIMATVQALEACLGFKIKTPSGRRGQKITPSLPWVSVLPLAQRVWGTCVWAGSRRSSAAGSAVSLAALSQGAFR